MHTHTNRYDKNKNIKGTYSHLKSVTRLWWLCCLRSMNDEEAKVQVTMWQAFALRDSKIEVHTIPQVHASSFHELSASIFGTPPIKTACCTIHMECTIPNRYIKLFAKSISCMAKVGEELFIEANEQKVCRRFVLSLQISLCLCVFHSSSCGHWTLPVRPFLRSIWTLVSSTITSWRTDKSEITKWNWR